MIHLEDLDISGIFEEMESLHEEFSAYPKQSLGHRSYLCEKVIEKRSGGKLKRLQDHPLGDFEIKEYPPSYLESKELKNAFRKNITPEIIVKNFHGKCLGKPPKTYDYLIVWDINSKMVGLFDQQYVYDRMVVKDAGVTVRLELHRAIETKSLNDITKL